MRYVLVLAVLEVALVVVGFGLTVAGDEQRSGDEGVCRGLLASPDASPIASPLALPVGTRIEPIVASPMTSIDCATPGVDLTP